jgi:PKD repeat protein
VFAVAGMTVVPDGLAHATSVCPESAASVVVELPDGSSTTVTAGEICSEADVVDTQYFTRAVAGTEPQAQPYVQQGLSVRALLQSVGVDPDTVNFVGIPRTDGTLSTLVASNGDVDDPSDFEDGLLPVLWVNGDYIDYTRPLRSDSDLNSRDEVQSPQGGVLDLAVHSGPQLTVTASADHTSVTTGRVLDFTAHAPGAPSASQPLTYTWTFGDGSAATGPTPTHSYSVAGSFDVQVTASGADDSGGVSAPVLITVGKPPAQPGPGGGSGHGTNKNPHAPATGPTTGGGHRVGSRPAKHSSSGNAAVLPPPTTQPPSAPQHAKPLGHRPRLATAGVEQLPLVHGRVVGRGAVLTAAETAINPATSPGAGSGGAANAAAVVGGVAAVLLLFAAGVARELTSAGRRTTAVPPR